MDTPSRFWSRLPFLGRLLVTASSALLVAGSAMVFVSAGQDAAEARADLQTLLVAELDTLPAALAEVVVIGDFSTLQQTLDRYVRRPQVTEILFRDGSGAVVRSQDRPLLPQSPLWFRQLLDFTDVSGQAEVTVGGHTYGRLSMTLSALSSADRAWHHLLHHLAILALAVGLDFLGIWVVLRSGLAPLLALKAGAEALAAGALERRLPLHGSPELRGLITAFNAMADSLHSTQRQLLRRNEELVRFSEIAAHHLQEPTRRLVVFAQRLRGRLHGAALDEDGAASLTFIEQEAARLRNLVHDIELYLAAGQPLGAVEPQDTAAVAAAALRARAEDLRDAGAEVEVGLLPSVTLDRRRLLEIFAITIDNALRYRHPDRPLRLHLSGEAYGGFVRLRVEDNGSGIAAEYRERVFRVFERLHPGSDETSTGIGLAILRRIAESAGGGAFIADDAGTGAGAGTAVVVDLRPGGTT